MNRKMSIAQFQKIVWDYFKKNRRDLPWRKRIHPYRILVSEVMLQQTQASRVVPKYRLFLKIFPNFKSLALASSEEVLRVWSGLGYNRRALYLKKTAAIIIKSYAGQLPSTVEALTKLPGIGKNTAGAVVAYAHNQPAIFIETNIRRVFIHHFFHNQKNISDAQLMPLIEKTLPPSLYFVHGRERSKQPSAYSVREWYWALMDYGSYLAKVTDNPNRRSKHYTKQSKFAGSLRQVRGKILRLLISGGPISVLNLEKYVGDERLAEVLEGLKRDSFITMEKNKVSIKK